MRRVQPLRLAAALTSVALLLLLAAPASATTWYSGQRVFGRVSVEPAVNDADGSEVFLLTPAGAQTNANPRAHAPLYLVLYPNASAVPASSLNCVPTNCDHVPDFPGYDNGLAGGLKGHDHLVGLPHTGDFNVAWDVHPVFFTPKGIADHADDTRILTLTQMWAAVHAGDAVVVPSIVLSFNCSSTSIATYLHGTPFSTK
ncbi:MAG TPA: hypothetical protein VIR16_02000 [Candidatus Limnocylindrales bacterium]